MENKELNRLKVVLAEKNQQMACRAIRQRPCNDFQMVHQQCATQFGESCRNCQMP